MSSVGRAAPGIDLQFFVTVGRFFGLLLCTLLFGTGAIETARRCRLAQEVDVCEDGRPLQEVWMVLEFCNSGTLSDAIQRGWLLSGARIKSILDFRGAS